MMLTLAGTALAYTLGYFHGAGMWRMRLTRQPTPHAITPEEAASLRSLIDADAERAAHVQTDRALPEQCTKPL